MEDKIIIRAVGSHRLPAYKIYGFSFDYFLCIFFRFQVVGMAYNMTDGVLTPFGGLSDSYLHFPHPALIDLASPESSMAITRPLYTLDVTAEIGWELVLSKCNTLEFGDPL